MPRLYNRNEQLETRRRLRRQATDAEVLLWHYLRAGRLGGFRFRRQYGIGPFVVDFYCPRRRVAVEIDGDPHMTTQGRAYDRERDDWITGLGIRVLRFTNQDILERFGITISSLREALTPP